MNNYAHKCMCGGLMYYQICTHKASVLGKKIIVRETPCYMCESRGEIEFNLEDEVSSCLAWAYRNNIDEIVYSDVYKNAIKSK